MTELKIPVTVIGTLKTPHKSISDMPIQPIGAKAFQGRAVLYDDFMEGLKDLDGFSHIILIYHFHQVKDYKLSVKPFMDNVEHGIFATRSPLRPSKLGMSAVRIIQIKGNEIYFEGADMLNDTPLLDIKPFFRQTDNISEAISGWLDEKDANLAEITRSDNRFA